MYSSSCFPTTAAVVLLVLPLLSTTKAHGQVAPPASTTTITTGPDSTQVNTVVVPDSVRRTAKLFGLKMTKPSKAGLLSALLPGAGQIYNRRWWKLPLVYGAVGGTLYGELYYQRQYKTFIEARDNRISGQPDNNPITQGLQGNTIDRGINVYRRQRDIFIAYVALAHAVQILDAVVDAHLKDFDISDDLSLRWQPTFIYMPTAAVTPAVGLTLTFK